MERIRCVFGIVINPLKKHGNNRFRAFLLCDVAPADDHVTVVKDRRLTAGRRPLGLVEHDVGVGVVNGVYGSRRSPMLVADFDIGADGVIQALQRDQIQIFHVHFLGKESIVGG